MRFAALLAEIAVAAPDATTARQSALLTALGIERPSYPRDAEALIAAMHADKKARSGTVRFVFVPEPGRHIVTPIDDGLIRLALDTFFEREPERG